jgi:3',5'-cyclic AMP phosphodiesterase CpdA
MKRRDFLSTLSAALAGSMFEAGAAPAAPAPAASERLRMRPDGTFKILAISDLHYIAEPNRHALDLTESLIAAEQPDLVIVTGDNVSGAHCANADDLRAAIANVAEVMERLRTPWAVTLGNHDQEHVERTGISREQVFALYEQYPGNLNRGWVRGLHGAGNKNILLYDGAGRTPMFNLWLLDSGAGDNNPEIRYDWIHSDQVAWYWRTSLELERQHGRAIPGLMFFHIPLPEFHEMILAKKVLGERHEPECPSGINGGLFAAVLERGDVRGIFCGHDHVNTYVGKWHGVTLGYVGVVGYMGYPHIPPEDEGNGRARGGRVFLLKAGEPAGFRTWIRFRDGTVNWEYRSESYERAEIG